MLLSLSVKQFALIEKAHLELEPGMTVFTGETGAGKSMLIDALSAVFGARASSDWVRHGAEQAEVTVVWDVSDERITALLADHGIEQEDELIIRRVVRKDGRSRAYINGMPVALKVIQGLGQICLDLHGQHEHQVLMRTAFQRGVLDARISPDLISDVHERFLQWQQIGAKLHALHSARGDTERQVEWMREELSRLRSLQLEPGLCERLQGDVDAGRNHVQIQQAASEALRLLDESELNARLLIARAGQSVASMEMFHSGLKNSSEIIEQIDALLGELTPELRSVMDESYDERRLQQDEERLMQLFEAKRRHDRDEEGLIALMQEWEGRLSALDTAGWDESSLQQALKHAADQYIEASTRLMDARERCGEELAGQLRPLLDRLSLSGMQVRFNLSADIDDSGSWRADGFDQLVMQVMSNPGEPWRDLSAVASGGELSRLILALKGCGALSRMPKLAVFDEVDTGIGGETAWCVGELLALMGSERQVLVISHLPQVASCADHQVVINKQIQGGRTLTVLRVVEDGQRRDEVARMLGGVDEESSAHAEAMLTRGRGAMAV